jgi:hypothetical protein
MFGCFVAPQVRQAEGTQFGFLHHFCVVLHAFAASVSVGELEGVESSEAFESLIGNTELVVFQAASLWSPTAFPTATSSCSEVTTLQIIHPSPTKFH